jgi:muramoyltetrapeptide carboxypeptidase
VTALLGTPYEIETSGAILFLEEVAEKPFRIDRMLNQLRLSGKLKGVRGVLLGGFPGCEGRDPDGDLQPREIFLDYFRPLRVPVLTDFPAGHVPDQATLPIGAKVRLDATQGRLTILECPVAESRDQGSNAPADENAPR